MDNAVTCAVMALFMFAAGLSGASIIQDMAGPASFPPGLKFDGLVVACSLGSAFLLFWVPSHVSFRVLTWAGWATFWASLGLSGVMLALAIRDIIYLANH